MTLSRRTALLSGVAALFAPALPKAKVWPDATATMAGRTSVVVSVRGLETSALHLDFINRRFSVNGKSYPVLADIPGFEAAGGADIGWDAFNGLRIGNPYATSSQNRS